FCHDVYIIVFRCVIFQVVICYVYADGEAKPKISFPFFVGSPHTPRRRKKEREGKFLGFSPATAGSGRGAQIGAYDSIQSHHALRACD
ncbi:MAG: hypothetical protein Q8Q90_01595, partial [bacterium]|nr:hypothetical protein [bacterium]